MNTGDYARTKSGIIGKLIIKEDTIAVAKWQGGYELQDTTTYTIGDTHFYKSDIIKSSSNIIDLIEVGDYVNGSKVLDIAQAPKKAIYTEQENRGALLPIVNNRIESILTKQQFKSMEYKINE